MPSLEIREKGHTIWFQNFGIPHCVKVERWELCMYICTESAMDGWIILQCRNRVLQVMLTCGIYMKKCALARMCGAHICVRLTLLHKLWQASNCWDMEQTWARYCILLTHDIDSPWPPAYIKMQSNKRDIFTNNKEDPSALILKIYWQTSMISIESTIRSSASFSFPCRYKTYVQKFICQKSVSQNCPKSSIISMVHEVMLLFPSRNV